MRSFSLSRLAQYARYYYVSNGKFIISILLQMIGIPLLIGVLSREGTSVENVVVAFYVFSAFGSALFATTALRERGRKTMEITIPVSNEERIAFMVLNSAVIFPLMSMITGLLALVLSTPFCYDYSLMQGVSNLINEVYFDYPFYLSILLMSSCCLLINLLARRRLFVAYLMAFIGFIIFCVVAGEVLEGIMYNNPNPDKFYFFMYIDSDMLEFWAKVIYSLMPILFYTLSYVILRKRQMKW